MPEIIPIRGSAIPTIHGVKGKEGQVAAGTATGKPMGLPSIKTATITSTQPFDPSEITLAPLHKGSKKPQTLLDRATAQVKNDSAKGKNSL